MQTLVDFFEAAQDQILLGHDLILLGHDLIGLDEPARYIPAADEKKYGPKDRDNKKQCQGFDVLLRDGQQSKKKVHLGMLLSGGGGGIFCGGMVL
jgi:hypothetical protein